MKNLSFKKLEEICEKIQWENMNRMKGAKLFLRLRIRCICQLKNRSTAHRKLGHFQPSFASAAFIATDAKVI